MEPTKKKNPKPSKETEVEKAVGQFEDKVSKKEVESYIQFLSTGCTLLDLTLGGGFPIGKIINLVGDKSSGKTLLAIEFIAACKKKLGKRFKWFYDDAEAGFSFNTKELYGFDIIQDNQRFSSTVEEFNYNLHKQIESLRKNETLVYILDSLDALSSAQEIERDGTRTKAIEKAEEEGKEYIAKGTYAMEKQKFLSELFRLRAGDIRDKNCILIIISQVRANIGVMFGAKYTRAGGKSLDMYASQIIWLAEVEKHKKKERVTGITTKVKVTKNKVGKPFRECFVDILFDYGVDDISSNMKFLYDLHTPTGKLKNNKIKEDGKEFTQEKFIEYIENENGEQQLISDVQGTWAAIEEEISSKNRKSKWPD